MRFPDLATARRLARRAQGRRSGARQATSRRQSATSRQPNSTPWLMRSFGVFLEPTTRHGPGRVGRSARAPARRPGGYGRFPPTPAGTGWMHGELGSASRCPRFANQLDFGGTIAPLPRSRRVSPSCTGAESGRPVAALTIHLPDALTGAELAALWRAAEGEGYPFATWCGCRIGRAAGATRCATRLV